MNPNQLRKSQNMLAITIIKSIRMNPPSPFLHMNNSKELSPKVSIHKVSDHKEVTQQKFPTSESKNISHNHM